ncbi:MAG: phosphoribosylaminoimidazolesuccinocarboxamide synthase [Acidimicrobiia bacterium]|nr:phosphoribosylaminoimidazolesuccinocarboxamide synthase [Acidimicrobiia bacterium]
MTIQLPHLYRGKVRDLYDAGADRILMVASDRVSVFDVVLPDAIPDKGRVLTAVSTFWFDLTADIVPNHVISVDPVDFPPDARPDADGRATLVRRTEPMRMECIARGYLFGGAWAEYQTEGTVQGRPMPIGLLEAEQLPEPRFTPTTKAEAGHDLPMTDAEGIDLVGTETFEQLRDTVLAIYARGADHAASRGIILADTKFEFGTTADGELLLIDEVMTPDSSRYWPADTYAPGGSPASFDKQYVRDYYLTLDWDHTAPAPPLPESVIAGTRARYVEAYERITGRDFADWYGAPPVDAAG